MRINERRYRSAYFQILRLHGSTEAGAAAKRRECNRLTYHHLGEEIAETWISFASAML